MASAGVKVADSRFKLSAPHFLHVQNSPEDLQGALQPCSPLSLTKPKLHMGCAFSRDCILDTLWGQYPLVGLPLLRVRRWVSSLGLLGLALTRAQLVSYTEMEEEVRDPRGEVFWCRLVGEEDGCCSASEELGLGTISLKRGRGWSGDPGLLSFPAFSPAGVGKSSLLLRFADNTFSGECAAGMLPGVLVLTSLPLAPEHPGLCLTSEKSSF